MLHHLPDLRLPLPPHTLVFSSFIFEVTHLLPQRVVLAVCFMILLPFCAKYLALLCLLQHRILDDVMEGMDALMQERVYLVEILY